jgi:hypothetical protein
MRHTILQTMQRLATCPDHVGNGCSKREAEIVDSAAALVERHRSQTKRSDRR